MAQARTGTEASEGRVGSDRRGRATVRRGGARLRSSIVSKYSWRGLAPLQRAAAASPTGLYLFHFHARGLDHEQVLLLSLSEGGGTVV